MARKPTCLCGDCKLCKHRAYMRGWYARNRDKVIASVRAYQLRNPEKIQALEKKRDHRKRDPLKVQARTWTSNAIRDGRLIRQPCERCSATPAQAHHEDYSQPALVTWLCSRCHGLVHRRPFLSEHDDLLPY